MDTEQVLKETVLLLANAASKKKQTQNKRPDPTPHAAIRAALAMHEDVAASTAEVAEDPGRYATYLERGLGVLLACYISHGFGSGAGADRRAEPSVIKVKGE